MPSCNKCGGSVAAGDAFCGECGAPAANGGNVETVPPEAPFVSDGPAGGISIPGSRSPSTDSIPASFGAGSVDIAASSAVPNETYMGSRLSYKQFENFDPLNGRYLKQMLGRLLMFAATPLAISLIGFFLALVFGLLLKSDALLKLFLVVPVLALFGVVVAFAVWLFTKIPIPISEWVFFIDGAGEAEATAFGHMVWSVDQREVVLDALRIKRVQSGKKASRDYLELRSDLFVAYIACFAQGRDLFVGWTVWWEVSPFGWLKESTSRFFMAVFSRNTQLHIMNRYLSAKALRETVHSAAREGVDVAMGNAKGHSAGTIGSDIPVELVVDGR